MIPVIVLTPAEVALLREVRASDEDHGGLAGAEITADEYDAIERARRAFFFGSMARRR